MNLKVYILVTVLSLQIVYTSSQLDFGDNDPVEPDSERAIVSEENIGIPGVPLGSATDKSESDEAHENDHETSSPSPSSSEKESHETETNDDSNNEATEDHSSEAKGASEEKAIDPSNAASETDSSNAESKRPKLPVRPHARPRPRPRLPPKPVKAVAAVVGAKVAAKAIKHSPLTKKAPEVHNRLGLPRLGFKLRPAKKGRGFGSRMPIYPENVCHSRSDPGHCSLMIGRWYYDQRYHRCLPFLYTGCGGNYNNFLSFKQCEEATRRCDFFQHPFSNHPYFSNHSPDYNMMNPLSGLSPDYVLAG